MGGKFHMLRISEQDVACRVLSIMHISYTTCELHTKMSHLSVTLLNIIKWSLYHYEEAGRLVHVLMGVQNVWSLNLLMEGSFVGNGLSSF